jgi:hypothetical protein
MEIEKGQIITFENTTWFVEDVKPLDDGKNMFILKKSEMAIVNSMVMMSQEYACVDCAVQGELNTEITYHGDDYVCWPCFEQRKKTDQLNEIVTLLEIVLEKLKE